jgi:hypothetical protein
MDVVVKPATQRKTRPAERVRLAEDSRGEQRWKLWGSYLSERQWGTVREDYSANGTAWDYFPHDHARSRAYRWGEDGLAGVSDDAQRLCLALALWNGKDPILKERLFGLTNGEGNHGEDVKELYYYLDATPTHSFLKYLYKYPQREFPYAWLVDENRRRGKDQPEFELICAPDKQAQWHLPAPRFWSIPPSCLEHGCLKTATVGSSTGWWFRKARQDGSPIPASLLKRPRLLAWCRRRSIAPASGASRCPRWEIQNKRVPLASPHPFSVRDGNAERAH